MNWVQGSGFRVQGSGFRVQGFRGSGFGGHSAARARIVIGSEKPKKSGPLMRVARRLLTHTLIED
jgi:hypothetical protein